MNCVSCLSVFVRTSRSDQNQNLSCVCPEERVLCSVWVLSHAPSLSLLQLLTNADENGEAAILSVGGTFASMLADFNQNQLALELLEGFLRRGPGECVGSDPGRIRDVLTRPCLLRRAGDGHLGGQQLLGGRLGPGGGAVR